jgi:ferredoxin
MAKVSVDKKNCIGCELCVSLCPNVFEMKNGKSRPKKSSISEEDVECAKNSAESCPVKVIKVET